MNGTDGAAGSVRGTAPAPARGGTGFAITAAAFSAAAASAVPCPEPSARPPGGRNTVLLVRARLTWAGVSSGYCDLISAAMPATTALAAAVVLTVA